MRVQFVHSAQPMKILYGHFSRMSKELVSNIFNDGDSKLTKELPLKLDRRVKAMQNFQSQLCFENSLLLRQMQPFGD